ncbi:MAG: hypothetical protein LJF06_08890 [Gemmatimonadetes bacterium]|nr:hypothetical protein [Gemmatimonadota bacterium]
MNLASRGLRDLDQGPQAIEDPEELVAVRSRARAVHRRALAVAVLLTAAGMLLF